VKRTPPASGIKTAPASPSGAIQPSPASPESAGGLLQAWTRFWFGPTNPVGLHVVRLLLGVLLLAWLLPFAGDVSAFFGLGGWFDSQAYTEAARLQGGPPKGISWSLLYLFGANPGLLRTAYWLSLGILVLFSLGIATRWTALLTWLIVASFTANPLFDDEADPFLLMLALYLAAGYLLLGLRNKSLSWPERLLGRWDTFLWGVALRRRDEQVPDSIAANVALRLVQVHLAIILVTSGLHKLQVGDWWAGIALWFPLYPPLETTVEQVRKLAPEAVSYLAWLNFLAYTTLAWQLLFPTFAWRTGLARIVLLGGALAGAIGAAYFYQAPILGGALLVGCLAFLTGPEWISAGRALRRLFRAVASREEGKAARKGNLAKHDAAPLLATRE
jgi:hypothetical protein